MKNVSFLSRRKRRSARTIDTSQAWRLSMLLSILLLAVHVSAHGDTGGPPSFLQVYRSGAAVLELDMVIEGDPEDESYTLFAPNDLVVDGKGNIYVLEWQTHSILKFGRHGNYLGSFGGKGEGPGEFVTPTEFHATPDDGLIVRDVGLHRFTAFRPDGEYDFTFGFQGVIWNFRVGPEGQIYCETRDRDPRNLSGKAMLRIKQYSPDFTFLTTVDSAEVRYNKFITQPTYTNVPRPYAPRVWWDVTPAGNVVVANSGNYSARVLSPDLELLSEFRHDTDRQKVTEEDGEEYFAGLTSWTDGVVRKGAPDHIREHTEFPPFKPYFRHLSVDHEGFILFRTYERAGDRVYYDVFSESGEFIGRVALPAVFAGSVLRGGFVYHLRTTEEGPEVRKCRLVPDHKENGSELAP
jgi:hypothetical protein